MELNKNQTNNQAHREIAMTKTNDGCNEIVSEAIFAAGEGKWKINRKKDKRGSMWLTRHLFTIGTFLIYQNVFLHY